mmetsp:Transcript_10514/g.36677  ORF Transcript_10514/g.36677 Transcript_10514/m.36677 type:complete len:349 (-) Transcript_10514:234-1280(-)
MSTRAALVVVAVACMSACAVHAAATLRCYAGWNTHGGPNLTLPAAAAARLRGDIVTLYEAQVGHYPTGGPPQVVGWSGNGSVHAWAATSSAFVAAHAAKARADVARLVPPGWASLLVVDYESWEPLLQLNSNRSASVRAWMAGLAALHSPAFDRAFTAAVAWAPPPGVAGWPSLSASARWALADAAWTHFSALVWNASVAAVRAGAPAAKLGFWNKPLKYYNGGATPAGWVEAQRRLGWLYAQLDAFLPDLYPERYAGSEAARPVGMASRCGDINETTSDAYVAGNVRVGRALRDAFAPRAPVLIYAWWHYMCDANTSFWADSVTVHSQFAAAAAAGARALPHAEHEL